MAYKNPYEYVFGGSTNSSALRVDSPEVVQPELGQPYGIPEVVPSREVVQPELGTPYGRPKVVPSSGVSMPTLGKPFGLPEVVPSPKKASPDAPDEIDEEVNNAYADYVKSLADFTTKPLSQEDIQKRERAAYTKAGIGALGNVMNSFSNLIFTGQGAPSQTLPNLPDPHSMVQNLTNIQNARASQYMDAQGKRLSAAMGAQTARDNRAIAAQKMKNDLLKMKLEADKAEREGRKAEAQILKEQYAADKAKYDALVSQAKAGKADELAALEVQDKEAGIEQKKSATQANKARASAASASAARTRAAIKTDKSGKYKTIYGSGDKIVNIPVNAWNEETLGNIVNTMAGGEARYTEVITTDDYGVSKTTLQKKSLGDLATYIGTHINDNTPGARKAMEIIRRLGGESVEGNPLEEEEAGW